MRQPTDLGGMVVSNMLRGHFLDHQKNEIRVIIKLATENRDINKEKEIFESLLRIKGPPMESTGCVFMYRSPSEYLVVEEFGNDIRCCFNPESWKSKVLISNVKHLLGAVASLHQLGFVHCDLKPANILIHIGSHGQIKFKLCDLECAKAIDELITHDQKITECWAPPELYFCCRDGTSIAAHPSIDAFGIGLVFASFLGAGCRADKAILPTQNPIELANMLQDQDNLYSHLDCSRKPHYQPMVKLACRYCLNAKQVRQQITNPFDGHRCLYPTIIFIYIVMHAT